MVESLGHWQAVLLVVDPLLAECVTNAQDRPPQYLASQRLWMEHGTDIDVSEEIQDVILAGFYINFHLGKRSDVGECVAVVRVRIAGNRQQTLTCQCIR